MYISQVTKTSAVVALGSRFQDCGRKLFGDLHVVTILLSPGLSSSKWLEKETVIFNIGGEGQDICFK